ncbi:MAG: hypothetical protein KAV83_00230 [Desulfobacterales bacterium]|nr:hypothetical protein [Desulfobacterales bacterium]
MKQLKEDLQTLTNDLKALAKKTEKLMKGVDKLEKTQAKAGVKAKVRKGGVKKATVKEPAAKKGKAGTASEQVVKIIRRGKEGVDVPTLIKKSGFEDKKMRNIINRVLKQGKIRRVARGVYVAV